MKNPATVIALIVWVGICLGVGMISSRFEPGDWYRELARPSWTPPNWIFPVVWTALYIIMGIAAWLVWKQYGFSGASAALILFLFQLLLNGLWSWLFFGRHMIGVALIDLILLGIVILTTTILFWMRQPVAGILMVPYLTWVAFAGVLNYVIWRLNA